MAAREKRDQKAGCVGTLYDNAFLLDEIKSCSVVTSSIKELLRDVAYVTQGKSGIVMMNSVQKIQIYSDID